MSTEQPSSKNRPECSWTRESSLKTKPSCARLCHYLLCTTSFRKPASVCFRMWYTKKKKLASNRKATWRLSPLCPSTLHIIGTDQLPDQGHSRVSHKDRRQPSLGKLRLESCQEFGKTPTKWKDVSASSSESHNFTHKLQQSDHQPDAKQKQLPPSYCPDKTKEKTRNNRLAYNLEHSGTARRWLLTEKGTDKHSTNTIATVREMPSESRAAVDGNTQ